MNTIKYGDLDLLEGPWNRFDLKWGVTPSFGIFRINEDGAYDIQNNWSPRDLTIGDVVLQDIYVVSLKKKFGYYEMVVADKRILWQDVVGDKDYNVYHPARVQVGSPAEYMYVSGSLNSGNPWTFAQIVADIASQLSITITASGTDIPKNIRGKNLSIASALRSVLHETGTYIHYNPIADTFYVNDIGYLDSTDTDTLDTHKDYIIYSSLDRDDNITLNPFLNPDTVSATMASADGSFSAQTSSTPTGSGGVRAFVSNHTSSPAGATEATTLAGNLANFRYGADADTWYEIVYSGIRSIEPSTAVHSVSWYSTKDGAFTKITRTNPIDPPDEQPSSLFAYDGFNAAVEIHYGKLKVPWIYSDTSVILTPVAGPKDDTANGDADVECLIYGSKIDAPVPPDDFNAEVGDILPFVYIDTASPQGYLVDPPAEWLGEGGVVGYLECESTSVDHYFEEIRFQTGFGTSWDVANNRVNVYMYFKGDGDLVMGTPKSASDEPCGWIHVAPPAPTCNVVIISHGVACEADGANGYEIGLLVYGGGKDARTTGVNVKGRSSELHFDANGHKTGTETVGAETSVFYVPQVLNDIADVDLTGAADGDLLKRVAGVWVKVTPQTKTVMKSITNAVVNADCSITITWDTESVTLVP